jgi:hypothetical protein
LSEEELAIFELALTLGMPVYKLQEEMSYLEMLKWFSYLEERPVGWREDLRIFYILSSLGYKGKPQELFPSLNLIFKPRKLASLKGSMMFSKLLGAKGGKKLDILGEL